MSPAFILYSLHFCPLFWSLLLNWLILSWTHTLYWTELLTHSWPPLIARALLIMEPRPHSGGEKRVDSKADSPVFHPGRGAYTNPLSTDKTGSQEASKDERKGKHKTVCSPPPTECWMGSPTSHFKVWSHSEGNWPHGYECIPWKQNKSGFEPEPCCVYLMLPWAN